MPNAAHAHRPTTSSIGRADQPERPDHVDRAHADHDHDRRRRPRPVEFRERGRDAHGAPPGGRHRSPRGDLRRLRAAARWVQRQFEAAGYDVTSQYLRAPAGNSWGIDVPAGPHLERGRDPAGVRPDRSPTGWSAPTSTPSRRRPAPRTTRRASRWCSRSPGWPRPQPPVGARPCSWPSAPRSRAATATTSTTSARRRWSSG